MAHQFVFFTKDYSRRNHLDLVKVETHGYVVFCIVITAFGKDRNVLYNLRWYIYGLHVDLWEPNLSIQQRFTYHVEYNIGYMMRDIR